jgi:predicted MFS family arabinose efflux permease
MLPTTIAMIVAAMIATRLVGSSKMTHRAVVLIGFLLMAAGSLIVLFPPVSSGLDLAPGLAVFGLGLGACAILPDLVQASAPPDQVSDVAGLSRSFSYLGQSLAVAITGVVLVSVLTSTLLHEAERSEVLVGEQQRVVERNKGGT